MSRWTKFRDTMVGAGAGAAAAMSGGAAAAVMGGLAGGAIGRHNTSSSGKGDAGKLYAELEKAGLQWSNRGKDGWQNLSEAQTNQALGMYEGYDISGNEGATVYKQNLQNLKALYEQQHAQEEAMREQAEMQAAMLEQQAKAAKAYQDAMKGMQETMVGMQGAITQAADVAANQTEWVPPYSEVMKRAPSAAVGAQNDTERKQALRRGLMSTFSRSGGLGGGTDY